MAKKVVVLVLLMMVISTVVLAVTPDPGHDAGYVGPGTFALGDFTFPQSLLITKNLTVSDDIIITDMALNTPTYSTVNDFFRLYASPGRITGGAIASNGDGTINVTAGTGLIRIADDDISQLKFFNWAASNNIAIPAESTRYIGVEYNGGSPQVVVHTSFDWNKDTDFSLGRVINERINNANGLHVISNPWWVGDSTANIIERIRAMGRVKRDDNEGGLMLSTVGNRQIAVTQGTLWSNLNEHTISAVNTNVSGTVEVYWRNSSGYWFDVDQSQYNVTHYNDITKNTLQTLSANRYANWWVYAEADDKKIALIYPQNQYTSASLAEAGAPPSSLPAHISQNGILIGRIVIKQGVAAPVSTQSAFSTVFSASSAADHGNLAGLADDDHTQYLLDSEFVTNNNSIDLRLDNMESSNASMDGRVDTLETNDPNDWDAIADVPTATPANGVTTSLSTADQIYDWVVGLNYITTAGETDQVFVANRTSIWTAISNLVSSNASQDSLISARALPGACPEGQAVVNTTTAGVQCANVASAGNTAAENVTSGTFGGEGDYIFPADVQIAAGNSLRINGAEATGTMSYNGTCVNIVGSTLTLSVC